MKSISRKCITGGALALSLLLPSLSSPAQLGGGQQNRNGAPGQLNRTNNRQQRKNFLAELKVITDAIAKRENLRIVVDPALFVPAAPKAPSEELTIDKALDQLEAAIKGSAWRKVYLHQASSAVLPPAEKLANSVRALDQLEQTGLVLENAATKKATTFVKNYAVSPSFNDELQAGQFNTTPVYVFYALTPTAETKSPEERFADLQRQQMEMMMQMSPEEMSGAMQNSMQYFMNMDPNTRQRVMGNMMQAGMQMFMNMSPDQRNQLMQGFQLPGFPGGGAPPRPGGRP